MSWPERLARSDDGGHFQREGSHVVRRRAIAAVVLAFALGAAGCGSDDNQPTATATGGGDQAAEQLSGKVTFATWGGAYTKADRAHLYEPFAKDTGVDVQTVDAPGEFVAKLEAQSKAGKVQWDVLNPGEEDTAELAKKGLIQPLPVDLRKRLEQEVGKENVTKYGVSVADYADVIVCNPEVVERCPKSAAEFFDVKRFPGPRAMYAEGWTTNLVMALLADGVAPDKLFPVDADRAFAKLDELKPNIDVWWTTGDQSQQILRDEEVGMAILWDGRAYQLADQLAAQGVDLEISHDGALVSRQMFHVAADAPNPKAAFAFLEWYATHPEETAGWVKDMRYGVADPKALDELPDEVARTIATYPDNLATSVRMDVDWMDANRETLYPRFISWVGQ